MNNWSAIVLAAGRGARMRSGLPKVLHPVVGEPMVRHVIRSAQALGPAAIMAVVSPSARSQVSAALGGGVECVEQPDPLGTGHALMAALSHVDPSHQHLLVLTGDAPLIEAGMLGALVERHLEAGATVSLLTATVPASGAQDLGRVGRDGPGAPTAIIEPSERGPSSTAPAEVNVGAYCLALSWLRRAVERLSPHGSGEYYLTDLVEMAAADGHLVEAVPLEASLEVVGINTRAQLAQAEAAMQQRLRRHWMEHGVTLQDPATAYFHSTAVLEEDVTVMPNCSIHGLTRIGKGSRIGPNAAITDTTIGEGCVVGGSVLEGTVLEDGTDVGPYCHLRPGTHLEESVHVGSHVEIKSSRVGAGSRVGHFSYIGDAVLGPGVNIGAGAVTCNYDGAGKHVTEIGEGALIGSDTMLVAPVRVGARAVTGAGAVITHDVPPDTTVAGVPARALAAGRRSGVEALQKEGKRSLG